MKRCIQTHPVASFGVIPEGSLWADDSEYLTDDNAEHFVDVVDTPKPEPVKRPVRKFGAKKVDD